MKRSMVIITSVLALLLAASPALAVKWGWGDRRVWCQKS